MNQTRQNIDFPITPEEALEMKKGGRDNPTAADEFTPDITPILICQTTLKELSIRRILQMEAVCLMGKRGYQPARACK